MPEVPRAMARGLDSRVRRFVCVFRVGAGRIRSGRIHAGTLDDLFLKRI
jgi:hypothetical protein